MTQAMPLRPINKPSPTGTSKPAQTAAPRSFQPQHQPTSKAATVDSPNLLQQQQRQKPQEMHSHIVSAHPDALRRRQAALKGRATARVHAEVISKAAWWEAEGPKNFVAASSPQHLRDLLSTAGSLIVADYFSSWCTACRSLFPKLKQLAENNPDVLFVKVNIGAPDMSDMAQRMGVSSLPYFQFYKDGKLATQFTANLLSVNRLRAAIAANKDCADSGSNAGQASLAL